MPEQYIAIMCNVNHTWERKALYVVKEALDDVHTAIEENEILNVSSTGSNTYVVHFKKPGSSWYHYHAGIMITRNGEW